ncbi:hypothetical protein [Serratia oryzae]|uniref:Uncharacterized protein n=1 Tax=Serratia oryzae TaxID=2034155 RepID=A0A1S8CIG9_9GAMM|nr:hypothetical protein [Serratia oryzae]OMQ22168.1 hypothetical protein BMI79_11630 [Serratia oryzae]
MSVTGFDLPALELMIHQRGERLTVTGSVCYHNGYQITACEMISEFDSLMKRHRGTVEALSDR